MLLLVPMAAWAALVAPSFLEVREDPRARILDGVSSLASVGSPGIVAVFGEDAIPLVAGRLEGDVRAPVVAAGHLGTGTIVAFGHGGYLTRETLEKADGRRFIANCIRFAAHDPKRKVRVGVVGGQADLREFLEELEFDARSATVAGLASKDLDVLVVCDVDRASTEELSTYETFVTRGGGLFVAATPWGWQQLHPTLSLADDLPGNALLLKAGLAWVEGTVGTTAPQGFATGELPETVHASRALDALLGSDGTRNLGREAAAQVRWSVLAPLPVLPEDDRVLRPRLAELRKRARDLVPSGESPLKDASVLERVALVLEVEDRLKSPPEKVRALPAARVFPGAVPGNAPRVSRTITFDGGVGGWHSTGLYAAPGEVVEVRDASAPGLKDAFVQIGAHTDDLMNEGLWSRCPRVVVKRPLAGPVTRIASPFGGLIYVLARTTRGATGRVEIGNAVEAPRFVLGETKPEDWQRRLRTLNAPWAELETRKVILTLPSTAVRELDDPAALMTFWDQVLDACADLAGIPRERPRPERYVTDQQISAGYMHSGYPIMTHLDVAGTFADLAKLRANTNGCGWGFYHELGHNHQEEEWTFEGTGEVTNNLFAVYVLDTVVKASDERTSPAKCRERFAAYRQEGARYEAWKKDPFLALGFFLEIERAFGWRPFQQFFAEELALKPAEKPQSDLDKRTQWLVRMSRLTGRNLTPWFELWNVPFAPEATATLAHYPAWIADGYSAR